MSSKIEYRTLATALRAAPETRFTLEGTAASYNRLSKDLGGFREQLLPGCFTRSLASPDSDVICTLNHDISKVLGRTKSGTLKLVDSPKGLSFRCQLDPSNSDHVNLHASVKRGIFQNVRLPLPSTALTAMILT